MSALVNQLRDEAASMDTGVALGDEDCAAYQAMCTAAADEIDTLRAENERLKAAVAGVIEWDKRRGYIVPYAVRDPLHAAIREAQS